MMLGDVLWFWSREDADLHFTFHASGDAVCRICGRDYYSHPMAPESWNLSFTGKPFLHRICNGELIKT